MTKLALALLLLQAACSSNTPCTTVRDCSAGDRCVNKSCQGVGANGQLGESCNADADCSTGLLCNPLSIGFPNGYCTADCSVASCASGACTALASGSKVCGASCAADSDCRQAYVCCGALGSVCLPAAACTSASCARPVVASTLPAAQVISLGTHAAGDHVDFNVPANTGSITILEQARVAGLTVNSGGVVENAVVPLTVTKPDGTKAFDYAAGPPDSSPDGGYSGSMRNPESLYFMFGVGQGSTGSMVMPNTAASIAAGVPQGTWHMQLNDYAYDCAQGIFSCTDGGVNGDTYDVSVIARPLPVGTNLDVNFYIVGQETNSSGQTFTAANAQNDSAVKRLISSYTSILSGAGITVRTVNFLDVPASAQAEFGTNVNADGTGACDLLDQMFTLSNASTTNVINLFLVESIRQSATNNTGATVVGVDGSIPGPATLNGTVHSGAAVSMADLFHNNAALCSGGLNLFSCGADKVAYIAAHESGHFLGLFHTTEMEGQDFDPIADTAKCPCLPCATASDQPKCGKSSSSGQALVSAAGCVSGGCGGGDNLMFWLLDDGVSLGKLTSQQGQVMKLNPAVQ